MSLRNHAEEFGGNVMGLQLKRRVVKAAQEQALKAN